MHVAKYKKGTFYLSTCRYFDFRGFASIIDTIYGWCATTGSPWHEKLFELVIGWEGMV